MLLLPWLVALVPSALRTQATEVVQPARYRSSNGEVELFVNPSRRDGDGPARYALTRAGRELWTREHDFTLRRAVVLDDGTTGGYALQGGELVVAVLAPDGGVQAREAVLRHGSNFVDSQSLEPLVLGLALPKEPGPEHLLLHLLDSTHEEHEFGWSCALRGPVLDRREITLAEFQQLADEEVDAEPSALAKWLDPVGTPSLALRELRQVHLFQEAPDVPPLKGLRCFDIDEHGRFGLLRATREGVLEFVLLDREGALLDSFLLGEHASEGEELLTAAGDGRWLVLTDEGARAFWIDERARRAVAEPRWPCPRAEQVRRIDGGWIVLGVAATDMGASSGIHAFDESWNRRWSSPDRTGQQGQRKTIALTRPTVTEIDALEMRRDEARVRVYALDGVELGTIELQGAPGWPWGLERSSRGELVVLGSRSARFDAAGVLLGPFVPHWPGGLIAGLRRPQSGPDGRLWTSDRLSSWCSGGSLLELDSEGAVQRCLGKPPRPEVLTAPGIPWVDPVGRVFVPDQGTGVVHVFDRAGQSLLRLCPTPEDLLDPVWTRWVQVRGDGAILMGTRGGVVTFAADGRRIESDPKQRAARWLFPPGRMERWKLSPSVIERLDAAGTTEQRIENAPDGLWLRDVGPAVVGPDGSLVLVEGPAGNWPDGLGARLLLYGPRGEPRWAMSLPESLAGAELACSARRIAVRGERELFLLDLDGRSHGRVALPPELHWAPLAFAPEGDELWLFEEDATLVRFALPED